MIEGADVISVETLGRNVLTHSCLAFQLNLGDNFENNFEIEVKFTRYLMESW